MFSRERERERLCDAPSRAPRLGRPGRALPELSRRCVEPTRRTAGGGPLPGQYLSLPGPGLPAGTGIGVCPGPLEVSSWAGAAALLARPEAKSPRPLHRRRAASGVLESTLISRIISCPPRRRQDLLPQRLSSAIQTPQALLGKQGCEQQAT